MHLHNVHIRMLGLPRNLPKDFWNQTLHASLMDPANVLMGLGFPEIVTSSSFLSYSIAREQMKKKKKSIYIFKMLEISFWLTLKIFREDKVTFLLYLFKFFMFMAHKCGIQQ